MKRKVLAAAALLAIFLGSTLVTGCAHRHRTTKVVVAKPNNAKVVVIKKGHRHTARCGHYRHGGKWYLVKGHVHGKRCGHAFVSGVWIIR